MDQPESVASAVLSDDRRLSLVALRDTLAAAIDRCESMRDLAALSARLSDVLAQIEMLTPRVEVGDAVDEITARRAARGAGPAAGSSRTAKGS